MRKSLLISSPIILLLTAALAANAQISPQTALVEDADAAVERVLHTQQDAWNHHDLDAFMAGYWNSADLTFFSGAKQTAGWQATLDRYKATYASPGHEMGTLEFSALRIEILGPEAAFVRGAFHLTMSDGKTPHGIFTLLFRKFSDGWKIIHDHTSAAEDTSLPSRGVVPDEITAVKIAEAVFLPIYGEEEVSKYRPYEGLLKDGVWTVFGTLKRNARGGTPTMTIERSNGKVTEIWFSQ